MRQATKLERSQEGDDAYAQHEHRCMSTEEEYPVQKESDEETERWQKRPCMDQKGRHDAPNDPSA
jgi:hypothetical protein